MTKRNKIARQWRELCDEDQRLVIEYMIYELKIIKKYNRTALTGFLSLDTLQKKMGEVKEQRQRPKPNYDDEMPF